MNLNGAIRNWMLSTIRIEVEADDGTRYFGTASICVWPLFAGKDHKEPITFLVTCRHVVEDASKIRFFMIRSMENDITKPDLSRPREPMEITIGAGPRKLEWIPHPDPDVDLAAMPFGPVLKAHLDRGEEVCWRQYGPQHAASDNDLANIDVADDIVFIGYPNGAT